jgi:hypothetical protein
MSSVLLARPQLGITGRVPGRRGERGARAGPGRGGGAGREEGGVGMAGW